MLPDTEDMGRLQWPPLVFRGVVAMMGKDEVGSDADLSTSASSYFSVTPSLMIVLSMVGILCVHSSLLPLAQSICKVD